MFEFHQYDPLLHTKPLQPFSPYHPSDNVAKMSLLFWSEHCIECAAPACFSTCDLYDHRPDSRCRRFTFGMFRNTKFASIRGYGVEIEFKKWGKLEARANLSTTPISFLLRQERLIEFFLPVVNLVGSALMRVTRYERWSYLSYAILARVTKCLAHLSKRDSQPDAFLFEVYNPSDTAVKIQVSMTPAKLSDRSDLIELSRPGSHFAATITLEPGYSRHQIDRPLFNALLESGVPFDVSLLPEGDNALRIIVLVADFVVFKDTVEKKTKTGQPDIKCIVWDLDNTLWEGVLVEDSNVRLRLSVLDLIKRLDQKGIVMSLVSKNDAEKALEKLKELGIDEYFLYPQINWLPKSQNIQQIAKCLNIGLDTFAFIDDNPFELAEVGETLPMVRCISVDHLSSVVDDPRFAGSDSPDAKNRRQYYQTAALREQTQASFGDNYIDFLAHSNIKLTIKKYESGDFERVAELVQRTNQLNFSGKKYKREEIADLVRRPEIDKYLLACTDKFGSYGTVGFSIVKQAPGEIEVKDFMLSCRVQGKFIEKAFFGFLLKRQDHESGPRFRVGFMQTSRNTPAKQVLDRLNFVSAEDGVGLVLDRPGESLACDFIRVEFQD